MTNSASLISDLSPQSESLPYALSLLPDIPVSEGVCTIHTQQQIDLILMAIESLEVGAAEKMLATVKQLELQDIIYNRIHFWRLRCTNPWRRSYTRKFLSLEEAKALVLLAGYRAKQINLAVRELLNAEQQMKSRGLPVQHHFRLSEYLDKFYTNFRSRMNPRRGKVSLYLASEDLLNELALSLLGKLLFCSGTKGMERLWISLFDGEIV
jgi:hypothetical protein